MAEELLQTSLSRRMITRMQATHQRRRISIFSGPPGIGKTTAIDAFRALYPREVIITKIAQRGVRQTYMLKHVLEAFRQNARRTKRSTPTSIWELRRLIYEELCSWAGATSREISGGNFSPKPVPNLTIVFDEAQNLSRDAIEVMRFWNDGDRCYAPFPLGLVFVGNHEFSLQDSAAGESAISAAVADRALFVEAFDYAELTDDDLRMYIQRQGVTDLTAITALLRLFRAPRAIRSFRRVNDMLAELHAFADGRAVTGQLVREALTFA